MNGEQANAVAGPSSPRLPPTFPHPPSPQMPAPPPPIQYPLFLPPPGPPPPKQHLESTQDLLARFHLHSVYDKYVRPVVVLGSDAVQDTTTPGMPPTPGGMDKGKGREVVPGTSSALGFGQMPGAGDAGDGEDDEGAGKGEKKKKNTYKHLIKGIPGKHSLKKDDHLSTTILAPPKQRMPITPFDVRTQRDAFTVSLEGLKSWNPGVLIVESAQAREDRKKRKELKRLAKAQAQATAAAQQSPVAGSPPSTHPQLIQAPIPTPAAGSSLASQNPTPRPAVVSTSVPRPSNTPRPASTVPRPGSTVPRPGSTVPRPGSTAPKPTVAYAEVGTPLRTMTPTSTHPIEQRGKKREREEVGVGGLVSGVNGLVNGSATVGLGTGNGNVFNGTMSKGAINAKPGSAGVRPRPIKKQRMDIQGQGRESNVPVQQQPTPQNV